MAQRLLLDASVQHQPVQSTAYRIEHNDPTSAYDAGHDIGSDRPRIRPQACGPNILSPRAFAGGGVVSRDELAYGRRTVGHRDRYHGRTGPLERRSAPGADTGFDGQGIH